MSAARPAIVITDQQLATIPDASPERLAQLGLTFAKPIGGAPVDKAVAKAHAQRKLRSSKLPPRLDRGRKRLRVQGEQLAEKKARAARVLERALADPDLAKLLAVLTKGQLQVLYTVLLAASQSGGACEWCVDKIGNAAGVGRSTVSTALRKLHDVNHLHVTWRPRSGRKHEPSRIICGITDQAGAAWRRLTMERRAVDPAGWSKLHARRKELAQRRNLDTQKSGGEQIPSFSVLGHRADLSAAQGSPSARRNEAVAAYGDNGGRSAPGSLSQGRPPAAAEGMLGDGSSAHSLRQGSHRSAPTLGAWQPSADRLPEWAEGDPSLSSGSAERFGEVPIDDLDPEFLVPADGPLTPLQVQQRRSVAIMAERRARNAREADIAGAGHSRSERPS